MLEYIEYKKWKLLPVGRRNYKKVLTAVESGSADGFLFSEELSELAFKTLATSKKCRCLSLAAGFNIQCLDSLQLFSQIECLISTLPLPLNLYDFSRLFDINVSDHDGLILPTNTSQLQFLSITGNGRLTSDLSWIGNFNNIHELTLRHSNIADISELRNLPKLDFLFLSELPNLSSICGIEYTNIRELYILYCRKLQGIECLRNSRKIEKIVVSNICAIESLSFLDSIPTIKTFNFGAVAIKDNNLRPLERIKNVFFSGNKEYTHRLSAGKLIRN